MRRLGSRSGIRLAVILLTVGVALPAGWTALTGGEPVPAKPIEATFPKLTAAKNPTTLQLQADDRTVHGWFSGTERYAGQGVKVKTGDIVQTVTVAADNTFSFPYDVERPLTADCSLGKLSARLTLSPRPEVPGPTAFFVVDRTAYRPGQTLQFAAFLRREDDRGEFEPLTRDAVEVVLTSRQKGLVAARLPLRPDDLGRVVGSYTFTDADTLDEYELTIPDHAGSAKVLLAEYRKSKVRLKVSGTTAGKTATLKFEALDFLDKPMAMERGSFTAQVVRRSSSTSTGTLKVEEFVGHVPQPLPRLGFDDISEDDLLFHESESAGGLIFTRGTDVVAEFQQDLRRDGDRLADASIDLKPEWTAGGFDLIVDGVVTDATGREQHATETIAISPTAEKGPKPVELTLPRTRFSTGDAIEVRAGGAMFEKQPVPAGTLMVMRLAYQLPSTPLFAKSEDNELPSGRLPGFGSRTPAPRVHESKPEIIRQTPVTAVAIQDGRAKLMLAEPGAYRLIAIVPKADGTTERAERTILVKRPDDGNPFELKLDKTEYAAGERLTGFVRSRYADARALLTLRDSRGIAWAKPITFRDGVYRISEECPPGLRYGCTLDVLYPEDGTTTRLAHAATRVVPSDRLIDVKVTAPDPVAPGSTVKLDLHVNRKEPVDLIVSVYDRSLLAIQPDTNPNVRNFYHADDRAASRLDRELLRRRIGDVRLKTLIDKVKEIAKDPRLSKEVRQNCEQVLVNQAENGLLRTSDVVTLLRVARVDVYFSRPADGRGWTWSRPREDKEWRTNPRLIDLVRDMSGEAFLSFQFVGNTLLIQECGSDNIAESSPYRWHPASGWDDGQTFHNGFSRRGGLGGIGGFGGGGFAGGIAGGGIGGGLLGGGAANNLGAGGGLIGIGGMGQTATAIHLSGALPEAASPEVGEDLSQLPDLAAGVAIRRNFADTAYWNAAVRTDETGHATVPVKLPDTLTRWQVVVTAVSRKMHVGGTTASIGTFQPVMVWPLLPRTFTEGDVVRVSASVHNRTDQPQTIRVRLKADNGEIRTPPETTIAVGPKANAPVFWTFAPTAAGEANLLMTAECAAGSDAALKRIPVARCAAEQVVAFAGFARKQVTIDLPAIDSDSRGQLEVTFSPSLVADLSDTLGYLVEYPYGCVEQTMSRFLPAIKVSQIQQQFKVGNPGLDKKLPGVAAAGIKRLTELQYPNGSWGWWGSTAPDPLMTAYALYGLLQADAAGYKVQPEVLTKGVEALKKLIQLPFAGKPADRVYALYVLAHRERLTDKMWAGLEEQSATMSDGSLSFALETAAREKRPVLAMKFADLLRKRAKVEGGEAHWETAGYTRWADDRFEVTAAALKALVAWDKDDPLVEQSVAFFAATKRGNRWNSTKDTAMILFAMCDYLAKKQIAEPKTNTLRLTVAGKGYDIAFDGPLAKKVVIPAAQLKAGKVELRMDTEMTGVMYRAVYRHWKTGRDLARLSQGLAVHRKFSLVDEKGNVVRELMSHDTVPRGSFILSEVVTWSSTVPALRYLLLENPKPSGFETMDVKDKRFETFVAQSRGDLREDRDAKVCFHHEESHGEVHDSCVFLAETAGEFVAAPAVAELMYHPETRGQSATFILKVVDPK